MSNLICNTLICNRCGTEAKVSDDILESAIQHNSFHNFTVHFAYGSKLDMTKCSFKLCEKCVLDMMLNDFKIPPIFEEDNEC